MPNNVYNPSGKVKLSDIEYLCNAATNIITETNILPDTNQEEYYKYDYVNEENVYVGKVSLPNSNYQNYRNISAFNSNKPYASDISSFSSLVKQISDIYYNNSNETQPLINTTYMNTKLLKNSLISLGEQLATFNQYPANICAANVNCAPYGYTVYNISFNTAVAYQSNGSITIEDYDNQCSCYINEDDCHSFIFDLSSCYAFSCSVFDYFDPNTNINLSYDENNNCNIFQCSSYNSEGYTCTSYMCVSDENINALNDTCTTYLFYDSQCDGFRSSSCEIYRPFDNDNEHTPRTCTGDIYIDDSTACYSYACSSFDFPLTTACNIFDCSTFNYQDEPVCFTFTHDSQPVECTSDSCTPQTGCG